MGKSETEMETELVEQLFDVGNKLASPPTNPQDRISLLNVVFHMIIDAFDKLNEISSPSYPKRIKILETVAKTCSCVMLLDLDCEALVLEIFRCFLMTIRLCHPGNVFSSMEAIMTILLKESEHISSELLSCLLSSVKEDHKDVSPLAGQLAEKVINNCGVKLKPFLSEFIESTDIALSDYGSVVVSLCQENCNSKIYTTKMDETELNQKLVGSKIEVWWPNDEMFYPGVVHAYYPDTKMHMITYDDGDIETLILKDQCWQFVNSREANKVQENHILRPKVSSKRNVKVSDHKSNSVSGTSKIIREATMASMKIYEGRDGRSADFLPQKRPFTESETKTEKTDLKISEATNQRLKKAKALKGNSVLVAKESSTKKRKSKMTMNICSSQSVPQDPSPSPARTERG